MSNYFDLMPTIKYKGVETRDISRRNRLLPVSMANPYVYLPYTVQDNDRPEDVAYYYYGSSEYVWLVYLANNIIDPYHDWVLSTDNFNGYLMKKYAEISGKKSYEVIDWCRDETIEENIVYYVKEIYTPVRDRIYLTPSSFRTIYLRKEDNIILKTEGGSRIFLQKFVQEDWNPLRIYDYEYQLNENKRNIFLVDKEYLTVVEKDLKRIMG